MYSANFGVKDEKLIAIYSSVSFSDPVFAD